MTDDEGLHAGAEVDIQRHFRFGGGHSKGLARVRSVSTAGSSRPHGQCSTQRASRQYGLASEHQAVAYDVSGTDWRLAVADNGSGKPDGVFAQPKTGLGTGVVKALANQLDAQVATLSGVSGTKVSVTHATFAAA
jgi:two-component sensor histidine kinase